MKLSHVLQKLLTNKIVLNIVCALSAFNMIGYLVLGNLTAILFFIVLAILITHFSKNMIIVLGVPLILVNFLVLTRVFNRVEGFTQEKKLQNDKAQETPEQKAKIKKDKIQLENNPTETETNLENEATTAETNMQSNQNGTSTDQTSSTSIGDGNNQPDHFEVGRAKRRGAGSQIDYAATIEGAYDDLNNILGSDGIKKLTDDTQRLMKQQMQLASSMKDMGPMIKGLEPMMNQAKEMMSGMGDGKGMGDIMEMAKKFGIGNKKT